MDKFPKNEKETKFRIEQSPMREAYYLLHASTPRELSHLYAAEDQNLMLEHRWDYNDITQITNRVKNILENANLTALTEDERFWRGEILWFWYHHAISCAIWRYKDKEAAQKYSALALEFQMKDHPNKITKLFYFLTRDQLEEATRWASTIENEPEKTSAIELIKEYRDGEFYNQEMP